LMADLVHGSGLEFPALRAEQENALRKALGANVALANPLDYHTYIWGDVEAMRDAFAAMMQGDLAMGCVVLDFPRGDRCDASAWEPVISAVAQARAMTGKLMAILATLPETLPEPVALELVDLGVVPFSGMETAIAAMEVAAWLGEKRDAAAALLPPPEIGAGCVLDEAEGKAVLHAEGLRIPVSERAASAEAAVEVATRIGFPVVLKAEGIAHKTEAGAVALNLADADAVAAAARQMPGERFLVEEMISDTVAELLVGVVADPAHGYVLTLAAGGTMTELLDDGASLLVPASRKSVHEALQSLRVCRLLNGYRGAPVANLDAILDAVMAVQACVARTLPLEIEINPLLCGTNHATAADALIRIGDTG
ncbi:MAG: acetate--CoA ligase family protein, partial [Pseudomonadota bacterium]